MYYEPKEPTEEIPGPVAVGIDVSDSILITKYHVYQDSCALGIGAASKNLQEVEDFLDFILGEG